MLNEESVTKVDAIPHSNDTVTERIKDIAGDIEIELISRLHAFDAFFLIANG